MTVRITGIDFKKAESNPCSRVRKFKLDNERYRYLLPEEEPVLMNVLVDKRAHLKGMIIVVLGLGLRKREQLNLRPDEVDFSRNVIIAARTKGKEPRNPDGRFEPGSWQHPTELCDGKEA
jgi:integrase